MDTFDQLVAAILAVLPDATFGDDNDGQIIIYTNLKIEGEQNLVKLPEIE